MALRKGHGTGRGTPRIETLPFDELPAGEPDPARPASGAGRGPDGRFVSSNPWSKVGGRSRAGKTKLATSLGLTLISSDPAFAPYRRQAETFARIQCGEISATVGGGYCGTGPSSMVTSAALALAASRFLYDTAAGDVAKLTAAATLADKSSSLIAKAHEYAAKQAKARAETTPPIDVTKLFAKPAQPTE